MMDASDATNLVVPIALFPSKDEPKDIVCILGFLRNYHMYSFAPSSSRRSSKKSPANHSPPRMRTSFTTPFTTAGLPLVPIWTTQRTRSNTKMCTAAFRDSTKASGRDDGIQDVEITLYDTSEVTGNKRNQVILNTRHWLA